MLLETRYILKNKWIIWPKIKKNILNTKMRKKKLDILLKNENINQIEFLKKIKITLIMRQGIKQINISFNRYLEFYISLLT